MKKFLKLITCLVAAVIVISALHVGTNTTTVQAATKRTSVVASLLTNKGKVNSADWSVEGDKNNLSISNNGKVFKISGASWPGYRIFPYDSIPGGNGYYVELDVLKTNESNAKINLSGWVTNWGNGAASNIYVSSIGIDPGLGTNYGANGTKDAVWNGTNAFLKGGFRYRFWFRVNPDDATRGDLIVYQKDLSVENSEFVEGCVLYKLCTIDNSAHYAHLYFEGDLVVDNFAFKKEDGTVIFENDFSDASIFDMNGIPQSGKMYKSGGEVVNDSYLALNGEERLISALKVEKGEGLSKVFELKTSVKVSSTAGKAGIMLGMKDETAEFGSDKAYTLAFENVSDGTATTTEMKLISGEKVQSYNLGICLNDDFHELKASGDSTGKLEVTVSGATNESYVFENVDFLGYIVLATDKTAGAEIAFTPEFTVDSYTREVGTGADIANNFNTGYINPSVYENDTHPAVTLGENGKGIVAKDGILKFDGTSDGTHFAINGIYADFIMQFDWINYAWGDRPTAEDGTVFRKAKPDDGKTTELYSPLGIAFGKKTTTGGWADTKLLRFFDSLNLVQFLNNDEGGLAYNECMGTGFATPEQVADIKDGKINLYEETVNLKIVALNGNLKVYGVIMKNGVADGEHKLIAEFPYENCTGYISISTGEAAYFGIDNLRITKIDGWTDEQLAAYDNFAQIADEKAPETLTAPVLSVNEKTVSWEAVANATGYIVTVNGVAGEKITDTSFVLDKTEVGDYFITVKALGDGEKYLDSADSKSVTITIVAPAPDSSSGGTSESSSSGEGSEQTEDCSSCGGSMAGSALLCLGLGVAAYAIIKKKNR